MGTGLHPSQKEVYICKVSDSILSVDLEESTISENNRGIGIITSCLNAQGAHFQIN